MLKSHSGVEDAAFILEIESLSAVGQWEICSSLFHVASNLLFGYGFRVDGATSPTSDSPTVDVHDRKEKAQKSQHHAVHSKAEEKATLLDPVGGFEGEGEADDAPETRDIDEDRSVHVSGQSWNRAIANNLPCPLGIALHNVHAEHRIRSQEAQGNAEDPP
jgi:hypothetical protein